jgi:hypothetical protein
MKRKNEGSLIFFLAFVLTMAPMSRDTLFAANSNTTGAAGGAGYSIDLSSYAGKWVYQEDSKCYALTGVVYCSKPADPTYESMNIYVPAVYMTADGALTNKVFNGYTAETAPIIYANGVGGYSQAAPEILSKDSRSYSRFIAYLQKGYILVSAGARGRQTKDGKGKFTGKAPEGLVDLKAGVRFLKHNDKVLAGDSGKIVSIGTSAGGAMSSLLGATGNAGEYLPYLKEIGAVMDEGDEIYAAMCYCPITDLNNADMAYEWMFQGDNNYSFMGRSGVLTPFQQALSADLAAGFPGYINGLKLDPDKDGKALTLSNDYSGTYYDYLLKKLGDALADYLTRTYSKRSGGMTSYFYIDKDPVDKYIAGLNRDAQDNALKAPWVSVSYDTRSVSTGPSQLTSYNVIGRVTISSLKDFIKNYRSRGKMCTAFDDLIRGQAENQEFGSATTDYMHFDTTVAALLKKNEGKYAALAVITGSDYNYSAALANAYAEANDANMIKRVALLNPMNYIGNAAKKSTTAPFFRIRVGTKDEHTSFTVAMNLALALETYTKSTVDYAMIWNQGHGEADYDGDLITWIERICKTEAKKTGEQIAKILNLANSSDHGWEYNRDQDCYILKPIVDVASPELPDYEGISIAVPGAYMNPDFTINLQGTVNGYTAATAPIILNTGAAGYSPSTTRTAGTSNLKNGYINVECGNRGKSNTAVNAKGETYFCGDAPYCLVDQKAAVRWLKYNIALGNVPGSPDRIVTRGGSGGGAHAIMMAAMGNNPDFYPYLEKAGAVMSYRDKSGKLVKISDAVFACEPNSPITNLESVDMAYEWEWNLSTGDQVNSKLTPFRHALSKALAEEYIDFINGLGMKDEKGNSLTINKDGKTGSYVDYYSKQMKESLEWYLNNLNKDTLTWFQQNGESYAEAYINGDYYKEGRGMMGGPGGPPGSGPSGAAPAGYLGGPGGNGDAPGGAGGMNISEGPGGMAGGSPDMAGGPPGMGSNSKSTAKPTAPNGKDLSSWITIKKDASGRWTAEFKIGDWENYAERSKTIPSFDDLDLAQTENQEFGSHAEDYRHFDIFVLNALTGKHYNELKAIWTSKDTKHGSYDAMIADFKKHITEIQAGDEFGKNIVKLYNPERYILDKNTDMPKHVRIINGTKDTDASRMVSLNDYIMFKMRGVDTTLAWSWDEGHVGADPLNTSFTAWLDGICKK